MFKRGLGILALIFLVVGCGPGKATKKTMEELEQAKQAAEAAETKLKELERDRMELEAQLHAKERELADCLSQLEK